jgi:lipoprotein-releasing system permease protein
LNLSHFIAQRLSKSDKGKFTSTVIRLSILTVALGISSLLISFSILSGFKKEIRKKLFSFDSHIQIKHAGANFGLMAESTPLSINTELYEKAGKLPQVKNICAYVNKGGIIQANGEIIGINLKGVNTDFDASEFQKNIIEGVFPDLNSEQPNRGIVISKRLSQKLQIKLNDTVKMYFYVKERIKPRKMYINGIYSTGLEDIDEKIIMGDIRVVQRINNWKDTLVGGYDLVINNIDDLDTTMSRVYEYMNMDMGAWKITDRYYAIFDWLSMIDKNVVVLIVILFIITFFNIIASMVILIMERVKMIGILKALGTNDFTIQSIFWYLGFKVLLYGLFFGNVFGLGFCFLQDTFHLIPLDPVNYYMAYVPVEWVWEEFFFVNLGSLIVLSTVITIPLFIANRVKPIQAIRFD